MPCLLLILIHPVIARKIRNVLEEILQLLAKCCQYELQEMTMSFAVGVPFYQLESGTPLSRKTNVAVVVLPILYIPCLIPDAKLKFPD
jgi:hypothetical protein